MNIIHNLFRTLALTATFIPVLSGCTADDESYAPATGNTSGEIQFNIAPRTQCGNFTQTRVAQEDATAKWEVDDILYIYADFTVPTPQGSTTSLKKMGVLKCVDPTINYWKYTTEDEIRYLTPNLKEGQRKEFFQTPLRWPIDATQGSFLLIYAGSKRNDKTHALVNFQNPNISGWDNPLLADISTEKIAGRIDVMCASANNVKAGESIVLTPYKHLFSRLRIANGGSIYPGTSYSRIAIAGKVNLFNGRITDTMEAGNSTYRPMVTDGQDYFVLLSSTKSGSISITPDGKEDYLKESAVITIKPEDKDAYSRILIRPEKREGNRVTYFPYDGTAYSINPNDDDNGSIKPGDIVSPDESTTD